MLDNEILYQVNRPARYTGGEWNAITKDWDKTPVRIALAYPDTYEISMSNLAIPILYDIINRRNDALAERVFTPWTDMEDVLRSRNIHLYSLESRRPLTEFDIVGFSMGYELTYTNVLNMLDLGGIPVLASERNDNHPLIIAGGSCALNPEPMSDFIDAYIIGDGEEVIGEFLDAHIEVKGAGREQILRKLATISGVYVPSFYEVDYQTDGLIKSVKPTVPEAREVVLRRIVDKLPPTPTQPVVPYIEVIHDRGNIEVQRGCSRGCRFCQAGMIYRPVRERPPDEIVEAAGGLISNCGYDEVSLVSLNTSDYSEVDQLLAGLVKDYPKLAVSLPSLRLDVHSVDLVGSLPARRRTGLTFAPEAGSERLRKAINKDLTEESLLETATVAFERGWTSLKLYFMIGLPTETTRDVKGIIELVHKVRAAGKAASGKKPMIRVSVATFVPKSHTPFQWVARPDEAELEERQGILRQGLRQKSIRLSWTDTGISRLEAALSRGDRRTGKAIYKAWKLGCKYDAWSEHFRYELWQQAFAEAGLDIEFYAQRERSLDEILPWSHIDIGVSTDFLKSEYRRTVDGLTTTDCRQGNCNACGLENLDICAQKR